MAPDWVHGIHRGHRAGRLGRPPVPHRVARVEVWDRQSAAVVSAPSPSSFATSFDIGGGADAVSFSFPCIQHCVNDVDAHRHLGCDPPGAVCADVAQRGILADI